MIGLIAAIILFNFIAFKQKKIMTANQIVHIWVFTIALQTTFDVFVEFKYHAYWYFDNSVNWLGLLPHLLIVPAANIIFLNWFPFKKNRFHMVRYFFLFTLIILIFELITLLPEPWGFFHYGWWSIWHSVLLDPFLLLILLGYYKWICILEQKACSQIK
jgi:hypothetical protein